MYRLLRYNTALAADELQRSTADPAAPGAAHVKGTTDSPVPITLADQKRSTAAPLPPPPPTPLGRPPPTPPAPRNPNTTSELGDGGLVVPVGDPINTVHAYLPDNDCLICYVEDAATTLIPCGHHAMCR